MVEIIIKITGNTLLNDKVDELVKVARQIQETEESLDTKMEIKNKKEKVKKEPRKTKKQEEILDDFEEIEEDNTEDEEQANIEEQDVDELEDIEEDEDEEDISSVEELRKEAKSLFIKLTKKDRPKAKALVEKYEVGSFSELEDVFEDSTTKWEKLIKTLKKYVG